MKSARLNWVGFLKYNQRNRHGQWSFVFLLFCFFFQGSFLSASNIDNKFRNIEKSKWIHDWGSKRSGDIRKGITRLPEVGKVLKRNYPYYLLRAASLFLKRPTDACKSHGHIPHISLAVWHLKATRLKHMKLSISPSIVQYRQTPERNPIRTTLNITWNFK